MKRNVWTVLLLLLLSLVASGCTAEDNSASSAPESQTAAEQSVLETLPQPTVPQDGDPDSVTCKGSYTGASDADAVVATVADARLTNRQLWAWYWTAAAQYRQDHPESGPDFSQPLDTQPCEADPSVNSWQQYFLRQALDEWHAAQAMRLQAARTELTTEEAYIPNLQTHERCMTGRPATKFLYGYDKTYETNTMHQGYLDALPESLGVLAGEKGFADSDALAQAAFGADAETLEEAAWLYNYGYMYLTFLSYDLEPTPEETESWFAGHEDAYAVEGVTRDGGQCVDIRYVLLTPEGEEDWDACAERAEKLLKEWNKKHNADEYTFSEIAVRNSVDAGSAASGGLYRHVIQGQLPEQLEQWCFDPARVPGDTTVIRTDDGVHMLYFSAATPLWQIRARKDAAADQQAQILLRAKEEFPMEADYSAMTLSTGDAIVSRQELLYPDVAHERYPEVPLYLQQDYPRTWYGGYLISSHGCGITTFSMLTTYMSDEEWTPPEMCELYGIYCHHNGTDGMIFVNEPSKYNYYFREKTYDLERVKAALEEGQLVVSIQHPGYWTRGGHYILLEKFTEDGMVQVRDSNIANYGRLKAHMEDKHTWKNIVSAGSGYWIFEDKITSTAACDRCGTPEGQEARLVKKGYLCEKCEEAMIRRDTWLNASVH